MYLAKTIIKGLSVSKNDEQLATHSCVKFNGPNGYLEQLNKALVDNHSHCIFNGLIEALRAANVLGESTRLSDLQAVRIIEAFAAICPQILQQEVNENE